MFALDILAIISSVVRVWRCMCHLLSLMHGLKSQNRYRYRLIVLSINTINIGHIGPDIYIDHYYRFNMLLGISKLDLILLIYHN